MQNTGGTVPTDFDKLWDYNNPAATEKKFVELLPAAEKADETVYLVELLSQIARTQGLQDHFKEGHATLDRAEALLKPGMNRARARVLLERGRLYNSAGEPAKAMPIFDQAWKAAEEAKAARFAIDAVHMLAIAAPTPKDQIDWNLRGIAMVEKDPTQKGWLGPLNNNLGEAYAKAGEFEKALDAFKKLGDDPYALKDQSRMLRALNKPQDALAVIEPLVKNRKEPDGWLSAEYAECLHALDRKAEAKRYAAEAYELLKNDGWIKKNDPAMLDRLLHFTKEN